MEHLIKIQIRFYLYKLNTVSRETEMYETVETSLNYNIIRTCFNITFFLDSFGRRKIFPFL